MDDTNTHNILTDTWEKYNLVRVAGDKKTANKLLIDYISLLKQQDEIVIKKFVDSICISVLDADDEIIDNNGTDVSGREVRIQHPLFKDIFLPVLKDQYKKNSAKHIKWIGQLEQFFYSDNAVTTAFLKDLNITGYFEARHFFERSFAIEKNQNTLTLLLNRICRDINYYTHEVPDAVLVDPQVLDKEIMTFRQYWQQCNAKEDWEAVLAEWELIAKHWALYLANKDEYENFEHYLKSNTIQPG